MGSDVNTRGVRNCVVCTDCSFTSLMSLLNHMDRSAASPSSHSRMVERLLLESVEAIAAPGVAPRLLSNALSNAGLEQLPGDAQRLRWFVDGALFDVLRDAFGADDADFVYGSLAPILPRVSDPSELSQVRISDHQMPAVRPEEFASLYPELEKGKPVVLLSTRDEGRAAAIRAALPEGTTGVRAPDLMALFDLLQGLADERPVLVVDCVHPALSTMSVATILPDMPEGSAVLLWGASPEEEAELNTLSQGFGRFLRCDANATADHVAAVAAALQPG